MGEGQGQEQEEAASPRHGIPHSLTPHAWPPSPAGPRRQAGLLPGGSATTEVDGDVGAGPVVEAVAGGRPGIGLRTPYRGDTVPLLQALQENLPYAILAKIVQ